MSRQSFYTGGNNVTFPDPQYADGERASLLAQISTLETDKATAIALNETLLSLIATDKAVIGTPDPAIIAVDHYDFTWTAPNIAFTGYLLDIAEDSLFVNFVAGHEGKSLGVVTTYEFTSMSGGQNYYMRLRAVRATGNSDYSNVVTVKYLAA